MEASDRVECALARRLIREHPLAAAQVLERYRPELAAEILRDERPEVAGHVLDQISRDAATSCLLATPPERRGELITSMKPDVAARLLRPMPVQERHTILATCTASVAAPVRRLLRFSEGTAGALMDPTPFSAPADHTVEAARQALSQGGDDYLYVTGRDEGLRGVISLRELMLASPDSQLESLMNRSVVRIAARADRAAILSHPGWQQHHLLPVVDHQDVLLGVLRYRTLRRIERELIANPAPVPLSLAMGEMYWTVMHQLMQAMMPSLRSPPAGDPR